MKARMMAVWLIIVGALALVGCATALTIDTRPLLPTLVPLATLPAADVGTVIAVPPTFTPAGLQSAGAPSPTAVLLTPSPPPMVTETAVLQPAPPVPPLPTRPIQLLATIDANAPFLAAPPRSTDCGEQGTLFRSQFPSTVGGPLREYHLYLPPCYGEDGRAYPVLYLFHGSIQTDSHWADLGLAAHLDEGIRTRTFPPFIVVMPFNGELGNITSGNTNSIEGVTVDSLLPYIDETYCTWAAAEGRSIGGISRGGYWALMIAFRHPELFTAVAGHSSHLRFETDSELYNPLATYATADLSNIRIWMDWGETDFLRPGQQQLRDSLQQIGANLDVTVNPGGHNDAYWLTHLPTYLTWHADGWPTDRRLYPPCQ